MKINVIGLGVGNLDYFSLAGRKILKTSDIVIGGERQLKDIDELLTENIIRYKLKSLENMKNFINENFEKNISIIVSGDTGYYSLLSYIKRNFEKAEIKVIPGLSSFQYLFGKICETWEEYTLCSVHGREIDIIKTLKESKKGLVLLTDKKNSPYEIGKLLFENNLSNIEIIVGENLSYEDENIFSFFPENFEKYKREYSLNVVVLKKCI